MISNRQDLLITVAGLGYVGLPLLVLIANKGFKVTGYDINEQRIADIVSGNSLSFDYSKQDLKKHLAENTIQFFSSSEILKKSAIVIVCVPTLLDKELKPVTSHLISITKTLKSYQTKGQIIIYESSTYPGCTRELTEILEGPGFKCGVDFYVGFSPERIDPSSQSYSLKNIPKIVSGHTRICTKKIAEFYQQVFDKIHVVSSLETAEFVKLYENTFRYINIAYANEMALAAEKLNLNIWEIIEAAKTKPFGFKAFYPGPGIGGACIPVNPWYLQYALRNIQTESSIINIASKINEKMTGYLISKIVSFQKNKDISCLRALLVGAAYKKNVADCRLSPVIPIAKGLTERGISFKFIDPYAKNVSVNGKKYSVFHSNKLPALLKWANLIVIFTAHDNFSYNLLTGSGLPIIDTRGVFQQLSSCNIETLGKGDNIIEY